MSVEAFVEALTVTQSVTAVLAMLAAVFAGIAAMGSYRLSRQIRSELQADERLIAGQFHHPELKSIAHSNQVIQTTIFNKSKRKAVITGVRVFDRKDSLLDIRWSHAIDELGNTIGEANLIGVVDATQLFVRRADGAPILDAVVEIHHSFVNSPLRVPFSMGHGWDRWFVE
jgi:hypothetical protein